MAKKKVNKRYDYELEAQDKVVYERSRIQRKMNFLILRGPGYDAEAVIEENEKIRALAATKHFKLKFIQCKNEEDAVTHIKDANIWAGGIVYSPGDLIDSEQNIQKAIKKILIPVEKISETPATSAAFLKALKNLLEKPSKK